MAPAIVFGEVGAEPQVLELVSSCLTAALPRSMGRLWPTNGLKPEPEDSADPTGDSCNFTKKMNCIIFAKKSYKKQNERKS